jgi:hypothetical protein
MIFLNLSIFYAAAASENACSVMHDHLCLMQEVHQTYGCFVYNHAPFLGAFRCIAHVSEAMLHSCKVDEAFWITQEYLKPNVCSAHRPGI